MATSWIGYFRTGPWERAVVLVRVQVPVQVRTDCTNPNLNQLQQREEHLNHAQQNITEHSNIPVLVLVPVFVLCPSRTAEFPNKHRRRTDAILFAKSPMLFYAFLFARQRNALIGETFLLVIHYFCKPSGSF